MTHFLIPHALLEKTVSYLATKPYAEVYELIQALLECKAVTQEQLEQIKAQQEDQIDADAG